RLVASLLVLPVQLEGLAGEPRRFVHPAGEQVRLRQPGMQRRATTGVPSLHGFALLSRMLKLDRATIPAAPALCTGSPATTQLRTSFRVQAGSGAATGLDVTLPWRCLGSELDTP